MDNFPPSSEADARIHRRVGDALLVSYTISDEIRPEFTETYDIGIGGLAMLTNAGLAVHQNVTIDLELRGDVNPKLTITGRVRWSTYDELIQKYRTGIEFTQRDAEHERELLRYIDTIHHMRDLGVL
jgi:c-di-GMP-binding flagellar brake protein YcgR